MYSWYYIKNNIYIHNTFKKQPIKSKWYTNMDSLKIIMPTMWVTKYKDTSSEYSVEISTA